MFQCARWPVRLWLAAMMYHHHLSSHLAHLSISMCLSSSGLPLCVVPAAMANPLRFQGDSLLQWNNLEALAASVLWHVELMFRTRQSSSLLLHISSGLQHNLTLQVRSHLLLYHKGCWEKITLLGKGAVLVIFSAAFLILSRLGIL